MNRLINESRTKGVSRLAVLPSDIKITDCTTGVLSPQVTYKQFTTGCLGSFSKIKLEYEFLEYEFLLLLLTQIVGTFGVSVIFQSPNLSRL